MQLRRLEDLDIRGKKVFLRLDLNVPMKDGIITDDTRIREALPTIQYILEHTSKLAMCSHLGRPKKGAHTADDSLEAVGVHLAELLERDIVFCDDYGTEPAIQVLSRLDPGQIMLLENLRYQDGEEKNDKDFARVLTEGFDFYVNDAFGTVHREHASVDAAAEIFPPEKRGAGILIQREINALESLLRSAEPPFTVIIGGAKVSDKIGVIMNLLNHCHNLVIGGAMAYTFLKYKGVDVGRSRVEEDKMNLVETIMRTADRSTCRWTIFVPQSFLQLLPPWKSAAQIFLRGSWASILVPRRSPLLRESSVVLVRSFGTARWVCLNGRHSPRGRWLWPMPWLYVPVKLWSAAATRWLPLIWQELRPR